MSSQASSAAAPTTAPKWFDALPTPQSSPAELSTSELHSLIHDQSGQHQVLVVDVRRADIEHLTDYQDPLAFLIPNAINLPAQTFHQSLPNLIPIYKGYSHVVFHCSSSAGRGPRCAAWYEDALNAAGGASNSFVLRGGIKAWAKDYPGEVVSVSSA